MTETARAGEVAAERDGATLAALVRELYPGMAWSRARELVGAGKVTVDGAPTLDPALRVRAGARLEVDPSARRRKPASHARAVLVHVDREFVVVRKPAGLLTVEFDGDDQRETLRARAEAALVELARRERKAGKRRAFERLGVVSRLDKDTSGLIVFPRTDGARKRLAEQFRAHTVERRYLALAWGRVEADVHDSFLVRDRGDGRRGSWRGGKPPAAAKRAITRVEVEQRLTGPWGEVTLISCRLETGRQHQIRIHLSEAGHPLLGERVYDREHERRPIQPERTMLHAASLGFRHPIGGQPLRFEEPPPEDFRKLLEQLGAAQ